LRNSERLESVAVKSKALDIDVNGFALYSCSILAMTMTVVNYLDNKNLTCPCAVLTAKFFADVGVRGV
jgi:hypothetical protein